MRQKLVKKLSTDKKVLCISVCGSIPPESRHHFGDEEIFVIYNSFQYEYGKRKIKVIKIDDITWWYSRFLYCLDVPSFWDGLSQSFPGLYYTILKYQCHEAISRSVTQQLNSLPVLMTLIYRSTTGTRGNFLSWVSQSQLGTSISCIHQD